MYTVVVIAAVVDFVIVVDIAIIVVVNIVVVIDPRSTLPSHFFKKCLYPYGTP